jgi:RHS repeat-associated protein
VQNKNGVKTFVHYLSAAEAIVVKRDNAAFEYYFPYTDHLGSIVAVTSSNSSGLLVAEQNFDAWGRKRNPNTWDYVNADKWGVNNLGTIPTWLYRGYTGHEHLDAFGIINMNARLYDPILGRMLSPDNFAHEGSQGLNRYSYAHNNPLSYVDPDGNNPLLVAMAIYGAVNLASDAIKGNIKNFGDGLKSFGLGAVQGAFVFATGGAATPLAALGSAVSSHIPGVNIPLGGGLSISLSPSIMLGTAGSGFGLNAGVNYQFGELSLGISGGFTSFSSSPLTGLPGIEQRLGGSISYDNEDWGFTFFSTSFMSGKTSQRVGGTSVRFRDDQGNLKWGFSYENDGTPFQYAKLGDGGDSYRTAAASISIGADFTVGMRLGTGWRNQNRETETTIPKQKVLWKTSAGLQVGNSEINDYRLGALYIGYKGYNVGWNNDKVRHVFQNLLAHTLIQKQAWIPSSPAQGPSLFREYRRNNPFTIW